MKSIKERAAELASVHPKIMTPDEAMKFMCDTHFLLEEIANAPEPAPSVPDEIPDSVIDAVAEALGDAYDCTRVWAAWSHGTMGPDDFHIIANDADRVAEIARAALTSWFAAAQTKPEPPADLVRDVRLQVESEFAALLPGVTYMDEPDGGTPTVQEQVKRMAMDAERYRWLREERFDKPYGVTDSDMTAVYEGDDLDVAIEAAIERDKKGCES